MAKYQQILEYARDMRKNPTKAERYFWTKVRNRKLFGEKFYRQYIIQHGGYMTSESFFIADFYCHTNKLIIELDGLIHLQQIEYDKIREEILEQMKYTVIRFTNEEVLEQWTMVREKLKVALSK